MGGGAIAVYASGYINDTTIGGGALRIQNGGNASGIVVMAGGSLGVSSGGTALAVTSNAGASIVVLDGGYIEYA